MSDFKPPASLLAAREAAVDYVPPEEDHAAVRRMAMGRISLRTMRTVIRDRRSGRMLPEELFLRIFGEDMETGREVVVAQLLEASMTVALDTKHRDGAKERHFLLRNVGGEAFDKDLGDAARQADIAKGKASAADAIVAVRDILDMVANEKRVSKPELVVPSLDEMRAKFAAIDGPVIDLEPTK